jgi:hypothetical protein
MEPMTSQLFVGVAQLGDIQYLTNGSFIPGGFSRSLIL